jgi:hypothetical protein
MRPLRFATLGPAGTNSHEATERYITFHGLRAEVVLVRSFLDALETLRAGGIDHIVQVCAHPDVAETIERHHREIFLVDSFIAPTKPMGVVSRADVARPRSVGLMAATRGYFDAARWEVQVEEISNAEVAHGLLDGRYDSGFTTLDLLDAHPGRFRLEQRIREVDVVWLVYGRERVREGGITAWPDSPLARRLKARQAAG